MKYSFIIPAYNEEGTIASCLKSINEQSFTPHEVIVVDNNSMDKTAEIAEKHGAKVIKEKKQGISHAKNAGAKKAKGDYLCFIDADGVLSDGWLKSANNLLKNNELGVAAGFNVFSDESLTRSIWYNIYTIFAYGGNFISDKLLKRPYLPGNNIAIEKDLFWKIGGFEPIVAEDIWFSRKIWKSREKKVVFSMDMTIYYSSRGFRASGYVKTMYFWAKACFVKVPQNNYTYFNKE